MPTNQPTSYPRWADDGGAIVEPSEGKKDVGWVPGERPPAQWENWLTNLHGQWTKWMLELATKGEIGADWKLEDEFMSFDPGAGTANLWDTLTEGSGTAGMLAGKGDPWGGILALTVDDAESANVYTVENGAYLAPDFTTMPAVYAVVAFDQHEILWRVGWGRGFSGTPSMVGPILAVKYEATGDVQDTIQIEFLDDASAVQTIDTGFAPELFTWYHVMVRAISPTEIEWRIGTSAHFADDDTVGSDDSLPGSGTINDIGEIFPFFSASRAAAAGPSQLYVDKVRFWQTERPIFEGE